MLTILLYLGLILAILHVAAPLLYYYRALRWAKRPWGINPIDVDPPRVSIIVPTYNEADLIYGKLSNIASQDYPRDRIEVIVADSSTDNTPKIVEEWARGNSLFKVKLIKVEERGKVNALNEALRYVEGDVVVVTDVDSLWERNSLKNAVRWLSIPSIGVVSCVKRPINGSSVEEAYRDLYNIIRVGESKAYSTPIMHGELLAIKGGLIRELNGFARDVGADDSYMGLLAISRGFRAIVPEDVVCLEYVPRNIIDYVKWRARRSQHLAQSFIKGIRLSKPRGFSKIFNIEAYLHLINPWILLASVVLLVLSRSIIGLAVVSAGLIALAWRPFRTWVIQQFMLMYGMLRNVKGRELAWEKVRKG